MRSDETDGTSRLGKVDEVVQHYIDYNRRLSDIYLDLESFRKDGSLTTERLQKDLREVRERAEQMATDCVRAIDGWSDAELVALVTSPETAYEEMENPWQLDDIYARDALYRFIAQPAEPVVKAHEKHHNRMLAELKTSGSLRSGPQDD
jgi:hypothetical protein